MLQKSMSALCVASLFLGGCGKQEADKQPSVTPESVATAPDYAQKAYAKMSGQQRMRIVVRQPGAKSSVRVYDKGYAAISEGKQLQYLTVKNKTYVYNAQKRCFDVSPGEAVSASVSWTPYLPLAAPGLKYNQTKSRVLWTISPIKTPQGFVPPKGTVTLNSAGLFSVAELDANGQKTALRFSYPKKVTYKAPPQNICS
jgi:hypothetical protein